MIFNSLEFLLFFPIVSILYFLLPHKFRWLLLLLASCYFYMAFIPIYILILFFTIIVDYYAGILIENAEIKRKKTYLLLSVFVNIGTLMIFKYYNFFIDNINESFSLLNSSISLPVLSLILPIGLSFHTFQALSYTIEVYRGNQKAERHFGIYALYVMFYPQLVAGPIERPQNILHQFHEKKYFSSEFLISGLRLMLWGFFKKVVIADRLSVYVNGVFDNADEYGSLNLIIAAVFFSIEIYCDFSGYSDIAIGSAKIMGFDLMTNFNRPYFSKNIKEFWSRWHISLSTWFRDYVYIPLGGNRGSKFKKYRNVFIVFVLSGFWHGANWTFILWGLIHAILNMLYMAFHKQRTYSIFRKGLAIISTFILVTIAWIPFRASTIKDTIYFIKNMFSSNQHYVSVVTDKSHHEFGATSFFISLISIALLFLVENYNNVRLDGFNKHKKLDVAFCTVFLIMVLVFGVFQKQSFIYFQF